jgi:hypothetical protein
LLVGAAEQVISSITAMSKININFKGTHNTRTPDTAGKPPTDGHILQQQTEPSAHFTPPKKKPATLARMTGLY